MNQKNSKEKARAYAFLQSGQFLQAKTLLKKIIKADKSDSESLMMLSYVCSRTGEHDKAIQHLKKVISQNPEFDVAFFNLGNAYKAKGDIRQAIKAYRKSVELKPNCGAYQNLGNALDLMGQFDEARKYLKLAIDVDPDVPGAYYNLGRVLRNAGLLEDSVEAYERAIKINPDFIEAHNNLGNCYLSLGETEKAARCYESALTLAPSSLDALSGKIRLLDTQRKFDQAFELIKPHLDARTLHVGLCATFADFSHYLHLEDRAIEWILVLIDSNEVSGSEKSRLGFLLGKIYDKRQDYAQAFSSYEKANVLIKKRVDIKQIEKDFFSIKSVFNKEQIKKCTNREVSSGRPVFIVGMPRSGTSLVEQILASHPEVAAAGELETMNAITGKIGKIVGSSYVYPQVVHELKQNHIDQLCQLYLDRTNKVDAGSRYVTDKMPHNFLHLGLIQILFPHSKVIHVRRNPIDTCLSCYFQDFAGSHPYSNDLRMLASYYKLYDDLMEFWNINLNLCMMTVDYERLVSNQEMVTRNMIDFLDLEWNDRCIRFYENTRVISTASYDQVRHKIYSRSVERWRHYQDFIDPLLNQFQQVSTS